MMATSVCGLMRRGIRALGATLTSSMCSDRLPWSTPTRIVLSAPAAASARLLELLFLDDWHCRSFRDRCANKRRKSPVGYGALPLYHSANDHVVAAQEFTRRCLGAFALLECNSPIDDGIADALGLLDQTPLAAWEVSGVDRAIVEKAQLFLFVDDNVGGEPLAQDAAIGEPGDPRRQPADLVMRLLRNSSPGGPASKSRGD